MSLRKMYLYLSFLMLGSTHSIAQTVTGIVKSASGPSISSASVTEKKTNAVSITDSMGRFIINVKPGSDIFVSAVGYADTLVNVADKSTLVVTLRPVTNNLSKVTVNSQSAAGNQQIVKDQLIGNSLSDFSAQAGGKLYAGAGLVEFTHKDDTKGSQYLFDKWVQGSAVKTDGTVFNNPATRYNFNKFDGSLLITQDMKTVIIVDKGEVKAFKLVNDDGTEADYELVPKVSPDFFVQVLSTGPVATLYKLTKTRFEKANYVNNGLTETGHNYDEYIDDYNYYTLDAATNTVKQFDLKKKSIKNAFVFAKDNTDKYFSAHSDDDINEAFIKGLVDAINK